RDVVVQRVPGAWETVKGVDKEQLDLGGHLENGCPFLRVLIVLRIQQLPKCKDFLSPSQPLVPIFGDFGNGGGEPPDDNLSSQAGPVFRVGDSVRRSRQCGQQPPCRRPEPHPRLCRTGLERPSCRQCGSRRTTCHAPYPSERHDTWTFYLAWGAG